MRLAGLPRDMARVEDLSAICTSAGAPRLRQTLGHILEVIPGRLGIPLCFNMHLKLNRTYLNILEVGKRKIRFMIDLQKILFLPLSFHKDFS